MAPRREQAERNLPAKAAINALGVISPPPIHVQTPTFDGSLGTLFAFVRDHKVDLLDIPLLPICEAYFAYMITAQLSDLDEAAAALSALAYLLERKAWMLLPVPEPEPEFEEPAELIDPTAYQFAAAIESLRIWHEDRAQLFFRSADAGPDPYELPYTLTNVTPADLALAFERLLRRAEPEAIEPLNKPRRSLAEQMKSVLLSMSTDWRTLESLVPIPFTREEAVYWFLSLLELMRLGQVQARLSEDGDVEFSKA